MRDGQPNPDVWGNALTCCEIAVGIYEIVGAKKNGLQLPKEVAEEILPDSVLTQAEPDGGDLCFTDELFSALVADELLKQELVTDPEAVKHLEAISSLRGRRKNAT